MALSDTPQHLANFFKLSHKGCSILPPNPKKFFIIGTSDGVLVFVHSETNQIISERTTVLPSIYCMIYDSALNLWAGGDKEIHLYETADYFNPSTSDWVPLKKLKGHEDTVIGLRFFGSDLLSASEDGNILLWNLATEKSNKIASLESSILSFDISPELKKIVLSTSDSTLASVNTDDKEKIEKNVDEKIWTLLILSKLKILVAGSHTGGILILDLDSFNVAKVIQIHESRVKSLSLSNNQKFLVSGSFDQKVNIYRTQTMEVINSYEHKDWVRCVTLDELSLKVISVSDDETYGVVDFSTYKGNSESIKSFIEELRSGIDSSGFINLQYQCNFFESNKRWIIGIAIFFGVILLLKIVL